MVAHYIVGDKKVKKMAKRNVLFVVIILMPIVILLFCTFFGKEAYDWFTPKVSVVKVPTLVVKDGKKYARVPKSMITEDSVIYYITTEKGYSRKIYRIWRMEIDYVENPNDSSEVLVSKELLTGNMIASDLQSVKKRKDGEKVVIVLD